MWLHNKLVDIDSGLINGQCFDSRLLCANSKPVLNLSKAVFFLIYSSLALDGGEIKESCGCEQRFLSSLTEKKEQGTSSRRVFFIRLIKVYIWWDLVIQGGNKLSKNFNVGMTALLAVLYACIRRQMITTEYPNCKM